MTCPVPPPPRHHRHYHSPMRPLVALSLSSLAMADGLPWRWTCTPLAGADAVHCRCWAGERRVTYAEAMHLLEERGGFADSLTDAVADLPFEAMLFELPPTTRERASATPFEFVANDAPALAVADADASSFFPEHACTGSVAVFPNLGRDAVLVAPCPDNVPAKHQQHCAHLASYLRNSSRKATRSLWRAVGGAVRERLETASDDRDPLWLSTNGLGVSWLHVRLDSVPKYYRHAPYREVPA